MRMLNPELAQILGPRASELGFKGDSGMERLAALLAIRVGHPVAWASVRSYLNGHRTPPAHIGIALCEELDLASERDRVSELITEYHRRRRQQQSPNRPGEAA